MITQEQYKKIEDALCELKLNNNNLFSYGDGYDKAIDDAIEQVKKLTIPAVVKSFFCQHKLVLDCKEQCFKCRKIDNEQ